MRLPHKIFLITMLGTFILTVTPVQQAQSAIPIFQIIREAVRRVIRAVDLMIQRMQNETIALQNAQKVLENKLAKLKLDEIAEWTERQRQLYQQYFDELWQIKNAIAAYHRIRDIMERQQRIVDEYRRTWNALRSDTHFTNEEIDYMDKIYKGILEESVYNIDQVLLVINAFRTQMTDAKRLEIINNAADRVDRNYADLKLFNTRNLQLSISRAKSKHEIESIRRLYDIQN